MKRSKPKQKPLYYPIVKHWKQFQEANPETFNTAGIGAGYSEYLRNRLNKAFQAGWDAREQELNCQELSG